MNTKAVHAYSAKVGEANDLLDVLRWFVDDHGEVEPDNVKCADVARISEIVDYLQNVVDFIDAGR